MFPLSSLNWVPFEEFSLHCCHLLSWMVRILLRLDFCITDAQVNLLKFKKFTGWKGKIVNAGHNFWICSCCYV